MCKGAIALLAIASIPAHAADFGLFDNQLAAIWKTTFTIATGWRNHNPDSQLVGAGASAATRAFPGGEFPGATGAVGVNDDAELNFSKSGDRFSNPVTLVSELTLLHPSSGQGAFIRVRAWYDLFLEGTNLPHGNPPQGYTPFSRLSDQGFLGAARFSGADIYDAFYLVNFATGPAKWQVRLGRQAIDWGDGIFYPGINFAVNSYDYAWLNMIGAPVLNGGKLPVSRIYTNVALPGGWTLDGFFNLEWRTSVYPGCGVYFSNLDNGVNPGCNSPTVAGQPDTLFIGTPNYYNGKPPYPTGNFAKGGPGAVLNSRPMTGEPTKWSGWGFATHTFLEKYMTEVGFFYTNYISQTFVNSAVAGATGLDFAINTMYPQDSRVQSYAVSASSGVRDFTFSGMLTETRNFKTHYNAPDYIIGTNTGTGPFGFMRAQCVNSEFPNGRECQTWYNTNVTQFQTGGTWQFGDKVGLADATLTGETVLVWATNLPPSDGPGALRLGRYGNFGESNWTNNQGYVCNPGPGVNGLRNKCEINGFTTPFAWGYKLRLAATFPQGPIVTFVPALTLGHDVVGYTPDQATVVGGRVSVAAGLRTLFKQNYYIDLGALWYKRTAAWDPLSDRGQYTVGFGMNLN